MNATERVNLVAAGRQTVTNLSLALSKARRHGAPDAEVDELRADWLALGAALDAGPDRENVIRGLLEKHDPHYRKEQPNG